LLVALPNKAGRLAATQGDGETSPAQLPVRSPQAILSFPQPKTILMTVCCRAKVALICPQGNIPVKCGSTTAKDNDTDTDSDILTRVGSKAGAVVLRLRFQPLVLRQNAIMMHSLQKQPPRDRSFRSSLRTLVSGPRGHRAGRAFAPTSDRPARGRSQFSR
jgi:hypothetical protein